MTYRLIETDTHHGAVFQIQMTYHRIEMDTHHGVVFQIQITYHLIEMVTHHGAIFQVQMTYHLIEMDTHCGAIFLLQRTLHLKMDNPIRVSPQKKTVLDSAKELLAARFRAKNIVLPLNAFFNCRIWILFLNKSHFSPKLHIKAVLSYSTTI